MSNKNSELKKHDDDGNENSSLNKRFIYEIHDSAHALYILVHFFAVLSKNNN